MTPENLLNIAIIIILLPLLSFVINIFFGKRLGKVSSYIGTTILGIDLILALVVFANKVFYTFGEHFTQNSDKTLTYIANNAMVQMKYAWINFGHFDVKVGIGIDNLAAIMLVVVTLISFLVHLFSTEYMAGDKRFPRFYAYLGIFTFSMLGVVLANNFLFMYVFWELVGVSSYLLIGFWYEKNSASNAAKKAFLVNRIGDLGFFTGIMILFFTYGTFMYDEVFGTIATGLLPFDSGTMLTISGILIFFGAIGKSAQFPLHVWLPDAMEGPTPVSALIHAATMVAAGVYLVAKVFPMLTADALLFIAYTGAITAFLAATIALTQTDFKKVLAYSTVSQLGFMIMALGVGAYTMGFFHLVTHAWFKAALFLGSGSIIHAMHHSAHHQNDHHTDVQDIRNMGGLRKTMPLTYLTFIIATIAISGVPFTSGFLSKDGILAGTMAFGSLTGHWFIPIAGFTAAAMTAFYMFRLTIISFHGEAKTKIASHTKENKFVIIFPLVILVALSVWIFYSPNPLSANAGWFAKKMEQPQSVVPANLQWSFLLSENTAVEHNSLNKNEVVSSKKEQSHGSHYLNKFAEVMHHKHLPAMILSLIIAGSGIGFAFLMYQFKKINPDKLAKSLKPLYNLSYNKWYIDEIYQATIIALTVFGSKMLALFDGKVIDGIVNLSAWVARIFAQFVGIFDNVVIDGFVNLLAKITATFGNVFKKVQTGRVQSYIAFTIIAIIVLIFTLK